MTRHKKTDGERIALKAFFNLFGFTSKQYENKRLSKYIDLLIRKRMAEAWDRGCEQWFRYGELSINPYRRKKKEDTP